jgi:aminomethyltransferase
VAGVRATLSRTGYTGEDGYEIFVPPQFATQLWNALLVAGQDEGLVPAGLGARDTLRLEATMRLYGNDMDETATVLECDLGWIVGWNKTEFIGRDALLRQKSEGVAKKIVGFEVLDRAIARHGHAVLHDGAAVGVVTSGTQTPFLKKAIGMAYVPTALAAPGTELTIDVRGRLAKAIVVPMPFYKRPRS